DLGPGSVNGSDRSQRARLPRRPADRWLRLPVDRRETSRPSVVRGEVHSPSGAVGALRSAVYDRAALRAPGRTDHQPALGRRSNRTAIAGLLLADVVRRAPARQEPRSWLRSIHNTGVYGSRQQL